MAAPTEEMAVLEVAPDGASKKKEKKAPKEKKDKAAKPAQGDGGGGKKKETKLGLSASKDGDCGEWYSQVRGT